LTRADRLFIGAVVNLPTGRPAPRTNSSPSSWPLIPHPDIDAHSRLLAMVESAGNALSGLLQGLGDMLIWLGIVVVPFALPLVIIVVVIGYFNRRKKKAATSTSVPTSSEK
jgi:hypothetical protein